MRTSVFSYQRRDWDTTQVASEESERKNRHSGNETDQQVDKSKSPPTPIISQAANRIVCLDNDTNEGNELEHVLSSCATNATLKRQFIHNSREELSYYHNPNAIKMTNSLNDSMIEFEASSSAGTPQSLLQVQTTATNSSGWLTEADLEVVSKNHQNGTSESKNKFIKNAIIRQRKVHTEETSKRVEGSKYYCSCKRLFFKESQLTNHINYFEQPRKFSCLKCYQSFIRKAQLKQHVKYGCHEMEYRMLKKYYEETLSGSNFHVAQNTTKNTLAITNVHSLSNLNQESNQPSTSAGSSRKSLHNKYFKQQP